MESIAYFNYEVFDIPKKAITIDEKIEMLKTLLEPFDNITRLLIIESLFGVNK